MATRRLYRCLNLSFFGQMQQWMWSNSMEVRKHSNDKLVLTPC